MVGSTPIPSNTSPNSVWNAFLEHCDADSAVKCLYNYPPIDVILQLSKIILMSGDLRAMESFEKWQQKTLQIAIQ